MRAIGASLALALFSVSPAGQAGIPIPDNPLQTGARIPPNIMVLQDASGSMDWEYLPGASGNFDNPISGLANDVGFRAANANGMWYDPLQVYSPAVLYDGTSMANMTLPTALDDGFASFNGGTTTSVCLVNKQTTGTGALSGWPYDYSGFNVAIDSFYFEATGQTQAKSTGTAACPTGAGSASRNNVFVASPAFYVLKSAGAPGATTSYMLYEFRLNSSNGLEARVTDMASPTVHTTIVDGASAFSWTSPEGVVINRSIADEAVNFANWHTYYGTRIKMAKTGLTRAFSLLSRDYRVGMTTLFDNPLQYKVPVGTNNGLFETTNRQDWYGKIQALTAGDKTPLRTALDRVGTYFTDNSASGPYGPEATAAQLSCRQNFTILATDGYWNDSFTGPSNSDNTAGATITGPGGASYTYAPANPYKDTASDTLADVAMKYWKTDLRSDLTNNVPTSSTDPAFWQHMVTFSISIGASGTLNPATDLPAIASGTKSWPTPQSDAQTTIDDLWHAAVNGHGAFVVAKNPTLFYKSLKAALASINKATTTGTALTANTTQLTSNTMVYEANFTSGDWTGDVKAYKIDPTTKNIVLPAQWTASSGIPLPASRNIYYLSGTSTTAFTSANLAGTDLTTVGSANVVNYIRGDRTNESQNGGTYRDRQSVLGDIVDSSPVYDATTDTVYVGSNDGMLHAFNGTSGAERFAIVPRSLFASLKNLTQIDYIHQYFVDGDIAMVDKALYGSSVIVVSLGRGGKGLFAVDVSDVTAPRILWEFTDTDLGNVLGRPLISKTNTGSWAVMFGNGPNSTNDKAFLFTLDLATGALLKKIDTLAATNNGMINVRGWDDNGNGTVESVYGGDLRGNLWKFDVSATTSSSWDVAFKSGTTPVPLIVVKDASNNLQPITGGLSIAVSGNRDTYGKKFIFFGTGEYLLTTDISNKTVQSWYGVIDDNAAITTGRTALVTRSINSVGTITLSGGGTAAVRTFGAAAAGDMVGKSGWVVDLKEPSPAVAAGERIVSTPQMLSAGALTVSSIIPGTGGNSCSAGMDGWQNIIDPFTGGSTQISAYDTNGDGIINSSDLISGNTLGSIKPSIPGSGSALPTACTDGLASSSLVLPDIAISGGAASPCDPIRFNRGRQGNRISWREIITQ
jgi:type IV pilus assembly protein PilY1